MKDLEKNFAGNKLVNDLQSVVSRHTDEYNLSVARSNPIYSHDLDPDHQLKKDLKSREISMIALGGSIGTGLLISTGTSLKTGGAGSMFIAYTFIGLVIYAVMTAIGEVATFIVLPGGFTSYAKRYCSSSLGVAVGYVYLIKYLILPPNQATSFYLVINFWNNDRISPGVFITIILVVITLINLFGVKLFGQVEFWLSCFKVVTCTGLIILLLIIALGGGPDGDRRGFRYWQDPGAFLEYSNSAKNLTIDGSKGKFVSFVSLLVTAVFAYTGTELAVIVFAEAARPRKSIPKAIKLTLYRIIFFYVFSILFLGMCVNPKDKLLLGASGTDASASPFVIAIKNAKIKILDHIINACILVFVFSAANSDMYICSRTIYGLAIEGYAPKIFAKTNKIGVPIYGILLSFLFCCLAFMSLSSSSAEVFSYFVNVVSLAGLIAWFSVLLIHIRFMAALKAQGIPRSSLSYTAPLQPYLSYGAITVCTIIILIKNFTAFLGDTFDYKGFITGYIILPVFVLTFLIHKIIYKTKFWKAHEIDLVTHLDVIEAEEEVFAAKEAEEHAIWEAEGKPKNAAWWYEKIFGWIF
ncbi:hypothetical protein HYPBUDRAFT_103124 [Hyphopichia burtonii NRRL Y-1933]|uniref:Amino acid permease/ SLC12A domain-containing protein n=1 Tax=Hyphopichia burtonii NRRL Y-1933 TaxID=984485 RepID=A0A1E4RPZ7_9ASCO|nr:hypothetical protein HYPBUDRAFT_103124 [Hyphopichia burtonii NRRL Y-1933]ODV69349.1 hypothetical protein HYPBUDRAFT_103124 [Hyphopichia burtonii NRRL Y-1933]